MYLATTRTCPLPIRQPKVLFDETTTRTGLAGRKPTIQILDRSPVPARLVLQLPLRLIEGGIGNRTSETVVLHHPLHVQRLQVHRLVFTDDLGRDLVQVVIPDVLYFQVHLGEFPLRPIPVLAPLLLAGQSSLSHLQPTSQSPVGLGVLVGCTVATNRQRLDAEIDPDFRINHWKNRNVPLHGDADVVLSCFVPADRSELDLSLDFTMLDHLDTFQELRDVQTVLTDFDVLRDTEGLVGVLRLEDRELTTTSEEVVVRSVQTFQRELQGLRVHFLHPRQGLFQLGQDFAIAVVVAGLLRLKILVLASSEEVVVGVPDRSEVLGEKHSLFLVRHQPKSVGVVMPVRHTALVSGAAFIFRKDLPKKSLTADLPML